MASDAAGRAGANAVDGARDPAERGPVREAGGSPPLRVHRFAATERWLHWTTASCFLGLLLTGLFLYLPPLAGILGNRPLVKGAHLVIAVAWLVGLVLVAVLGDRRTVRRSWRQFLALDSEDLRWLTSTAARRRPAGRFNGGQKVHGLVQGALTILFFASGTLLYLGERNHSLRAPGALALHDAAMFIGAFFVAGHIWIALRPGTRDSISGMTDGTVPLAYATDHHGRWDPAAEPVEERPLLTPARLAAAAAIALTGLALAIAIA